MASKICSQTGKAQFPNKLEADIFLAKVRGRRARAERRGQRDTRPEPRYTYYCEFGNHWHLGGTRQEMESKI